MKYEFDLTAVWDAPYTRPIMSGFKYVKNTLGRVYPLQLLSQNDWADVMSAAFERGYTVWKNTQDVDRTFKAARCGTANEIRFLLKPHSHYVQLIEHTESRTAERLKRISLLKIARLLYKKLKKKGARGRKSAVIKAYVIQQKTLGKSFARITRELETTRFPCSYDNVKQHYRSATALLFDIKRGNIAR